MSMLDTIKEEIIRVRELMSLSEQKETITESNHKSSYMAKSQLYNIAKKAQSVHDRLEDNEEIDDWMESKIAQMADNIDSVSNAFDYDEFEEKTSPCGEVNLEEEIMSGMQSGYADTDDTEEYSFKSKGALGHQPELEDEGFTEPKSNYSKEQKSYNFTSDGPEDSYEDSEGDYGMELSYELGEQDSGTESGESSDGAGAGTASVGVWDSGIARGIANQLANTKWGDSYQPTRGRSNPLW